MNAKSPTLEQLRQTPHWSYSRLNGLLGFCSLAWAFKYAYGESPEFTPVSLVFGSAFHSALALAFDEKRRTGAVSPERATELFRDRIAGELNSNRPPKVRLDEKTTRESLCQLGTRMIEIYLDQLDPEERIVDVSVPFTVALPGVEKPLIGEIDAIVERDGRQTVLDWKTSARRWPAGKAATDLQPTVYLSARAESEGNWETDFRFDVVTKTKTPVCERHRTTRSPEAAQRLAAIIRVLRRRVWAEVFHPTDQSWECANCPYTRPCRTWHRDREKVQVDFGRAA